MRPRTWIAVGLFALAGPFLVAAWRLGRAPVVSPAPPPPARLKPSAALPLMGTASCSGRACHGSVEPGADGAPPANLGSYTLWLTRDKHASAYEALLGADGRLIAERLGIGRAQESERCLACHTNPAAAAAGVPPALAEERRAGVGCEACHGAARDWIEPHRSTAWKGLDDEPRQEEYLRTGMTWLRTPAARARVCAGCHVGDAPGPGTGRPARDVNHDLIAAGHPRLAFEYTSYLANLPRHWQEKDVRPGAEALAWAAGQMASAAADWDVLAHRAGAGPWPEFASYDCASCHHDLSVSSWRRDRTGDSPPGSLRPATWYGVLVPLAAAFPGDGLVLPPTADLRAELTRPTPDRAGQAARAREIARQLSALAKQLDSAAPTEGRIESLRGSLTRQGAGGGAANWDELEQTALALLAVNRARQDCRREAGRPPTDADRRAEDAVREIVRRLAYPIGYRGPRQFRTREGFDADLQDLFRRAGP